MSTYENHNPNPTRQRKSQGDPFWWVAPLFLLLFAPITALWLTRPAKVQKLAHRNHRIGLGPWAIGFTGAIWLGVVTIFLHNLPWIAFAGGLMLSLAMGRALAGKQQEPLPLGAVIRGMRETPKLAIFAGALTLLAAGLIVRNQIVGHTDSMGPILGATLVSTVLMLRIGDTAVRTRRSANANRDAVAGIVAIGLSTTEAAVRELLIDSGTTAEGLQTLQIRGHLAEQTRGTQAIDARFEALGMPWRAVSSDLSLIVLQEMSASEVAARQALTEESGLVTGFESLEEQPVLDAGGF